MLNVVNLTSLAHVQYLPKLKKNLFVYSLYSYFDVPNAGKESITNSMFKITLTHHTPLSSM